MAKSKGDDKPGKKPDKKARKKGAGKPKRGTKQGKRPRADKPRTEDKQPKRTKQTQEAKEPTTVKTPTRVAEERGPGKVKLKQPSRKKHQEQVNTAAPFGPLNWGLLALGVLVAGVGFVLLYFGDVVWSTTALVLGYCVIIPIALFIKPRSKGKTGQKEEAEKSEEKPADEQ